MPIVVVAKAPAEYAAWVKEMKAKMPAEPAPAPVAEAAPTAGSPAGAGEKVAAAAPAKAADGKGTYDTTCVACHGTGAAGAPKLGDKAAWAPRLKQGAAVLQDHAIKGKGAMPPKGGNMTLSDAAVKAAVDYMAAAAK
jgi:cytochrome c5